MLPRNEIYGKVFIASHDQLRRSIRVNDVRSELNDLSEKLSDVAPGAITAAILVAVISLLMPLVFDRADLETWLTPPGWLVGWTNWAVVFFTLFFGGRSLWWVSDRIRTKALRDRARNESSMEPRSE
jgi:hypothetical protein